MPAATGGVYARYRVAYRLPGTEWTYPMTVDLITDYSTFESIRKIIAVRNGVKPEEITVVRLELL